jgi:GNAT superfamily N-acetyltransferase
MAGNDIAALRIAPADVEAILPLRDRVIIAGTDRATPEFEGDREAGTVHFAGRLQGEVIACASFMQRPYVGRPAYQLRGMATEPAWQGRGVGKRLLAEASDALRRRGARLLWCNARTLARTFYERQGWTTDTEVFEIPGVGPHVVMSRALRAEEE